MYKRNNNNTTCLLTRHQVRGHIKNKLLKLIPGNFSKENFQGKEIKVERKMAYS